MYAMHDELIRRLNETKTMSIVGMCKNAGKTTMLNWLLTGGHLRGTLGLTSIGRDGESTDVVTGTEKPGIFVREGTLIATAKDMLRLGDTTLEIMETTSSPPESSTMTSVFTAPVLTSFTLPLRALRALSFMILTSVEIPVGSLSFVLT